MNDDSLITIDPVSTRSDQGWLHVGPWSTGFITYYDNVFVTCTRVVNTEARYDPFASSWSMSELIFSTGFASFFPNARSRMCHIILIYFIQCSLFLVRVLFSLVFSRLCSSLFFSSFLSFRYFWSIDWESFLVGRREEAPFSFINHYNRITIPVLSLIDLICLFRDRDLVRPKTHGIDRNHKKITRSKVTRILYLLL